MDSIQKWTKHLLGVMALQNADIEPYSCHCPPHCSILCVTGVVTFGFKVTCGTQGSFLKLGISDWGLSLLLFHNHPPKAWLSHHGT